MLYTLLRTVLFLVLAVVGIVFLFVAWWMAMFLVLGVVGWFWFRRLFGAPRQPPGQPRRADGASQAVVIEGEFEVEGEHGAPPEALKPPGSTDSDRARH